jgi:hypothetical protein
MHWYVLTFSGANAWALGSLGSLDSVVGFILPILSSAGEVKFMITSATIDPPKKLA